MSKNILIGDNFYQEHPENVLGEEKYVSGRFGTVLKVIGDNSELDKIDVPPIEKTFDGIPESNFKNEKPDRSDSLEQRIDKAISNEKKKAVSNAVDSVISPEKNNSDIYTFKEIVDMYNPHITNSELQAWLFCNPQLPAEKYLGKKGITMSQEELLKDGLICYMSGKFYYKYIYESGRLDVKISKLNQEKEYISDLFGEKQYEYQMSLLTDAMPKRKIISSDTENSISLLAYSELSKTFMVQGTQSLTFESPVSLFVAFVNWLKDGIDKSEIKNITLTDLLKFYIDNKQYPVSKSLSKAEQEKIQKTNIDLKQRADKEGERLFNKFLNEEITTDDKQKIEIIWNNKYNNYKHVNLDKIPVGFTFSKWFKNKSALKLSKTQRDGVAFIAVIKSGILAYDVGVGKTLSSIAVISYLYENGYAKFPFIVVPNNVYNKWIAEIFGGTDEKTGKKIYGALPHFSFRPLYNMNINVIMGGKGFKGLKEYSEADKKEINKNLSNQLLVKEQILKARKKDKEYFELPDFVYDEDSVFSEYIDSLKDDANVYYKLINSEYKEERNKVAKSYQKLKNRTEFIFVIYNKILKNQYKNLIYSLGRAKQVKEGTISIVTKEGLRNIGLENSQGIVDYIFDILSQQDEFGGGAEQDSQTERKAAALYEKIESQISSKIGGLKFSLEELDVDTLIYDEAHYAKKIFTSLKGEPKGEYQKDENGNVIYKNGKPVIEYEYNEKGEAVREKSRYEISKGSPSGDGLTAYAVSRYIQNKTDGRNIVLLTATPFENSPLEVYSMLSLTNHAELVSRGFGNMREFFDTFMRIEYDIRVTAKNEVAKETILAGFRNLIQFRSVVRSIVDYKTGEQANVLRPDKITLPSIDRNIGASFRMNELQSFLMFMVECYMTEQINIYELLKKLPSGYGEDFIREKYDFDKSEDGIAILSFSEETLYEIVFNVFKDYVSNTRKQKLNNLSAQEKDKYVIEIAGLRKSLYKPEEILTDDPDTEAGVKIIKSLTWMRSIVVSPFLFPMIKKSGFEPTPEELVETSPKLQYILECIKSVKDYHEKTGTKMSGQVIYSNLGVDFFNKLKFYLTDKSNGFGYQESDIDMISGQHTKNVEQKTIAMNKFLSGDTKILIGSDSIQVGVDLQNNTSTMYLWTFTYNPTSMKQVEGRIWRQGNRFSKIRIVYPMLENSIDPILFQYLAEKTKRIKDIWDMDGVKSQLDLRDFDPDTLKLQLVTDPKKRAKIEFIKLRDEENSKIFFWENQKGVVEQVSYAHNDFTETFPKGIDLLKKLYDANYQAYENIYIEEKNERISKLKHDIELREEDDSIEKAKTEKAKEKAKENKKKFIENAKKKIRDTEKKYNELIDINRNEYQDNLSIIENKKNLSDTDYWKALISKSNYFLQNYINDTSIQRDLLRRDEFVTIKRDYYNTRNLLVKFKHSISDYLKIKNHILKPLGATVNDIPRLKTKIDKEIEEIRKNIETLDEREVKRAKELEKEFEENIKNWKTFKQRAEEFASLNHEVLSDFVEMEENPVEIAKQMSFVVKTFAYLNYLKKQLQ